MDTLKTHCHNQAAAEAASRRVNGEEDDRLLLAHLDLKERHYREYAVALEQFGVGDEQLRDETLQEARTMETLKARLVEEEKAREEEEERLRTEFEAARRKELEKEVADLEVLRIANANRSAVEKIDARDVLGLNNS